MIYHLENLQFRYSKTSLLNIEDQSFPAGSISALVGSNGVGKSTLLRLLAFLLMPVTGMIHFRGQAVNKRNISAVREQVGLVPQNPYLLRGSVRYNLELGLRFRGMGAKARAERCRPIIALLGLEPLLARAATDLSGGEGQKVALGRLLALKPQVLLLDEPFTWLDSTFSGEFSALLMRLSRDEGKSVVFTSHDPALAHTLADQVYELRQGDIRAV
ncbi:MAG: energy-coupling factor ABC transporter ATP-binding protein [Candidatus Eutrophobiaceae bacterium]